MLFKNIFSRWRGSRWEEEEHQTQRMWSVRRTTFVSPTGCNVSCSSLVRTTSITTLVRHISSSVHPKSQPATSLPALLQLIRKFKDLDTTTTSNPFTPYPCAPPVGSKIESSCLYADQHCILVNDAFPKASVHCLVLPKPNGQTGQVWKSLNDLTADRNSALQLVSHMQAVAHQYVNFLATSQRDLLHVNVPANKISSSSPPCLQFLTGFHGIPSLPGLHMHVISKDFGVAGASSDRLKKKSHYNSFATPFFLRTELVLQDLATHGRVTINQNVDQLEILERSPLACLWCGSTEPSTLPKLKEHIAQCMHRRSHA